MKILTKEWLNDYELNEIKFMLESEKDKKIPFVFTNGGTEGIAKEDLRTVKTKLNLSDKDNQMSFVLLPDTFEYYSSHSKDEIEPEMKSPENDFLCQYVDRLRIISYLPEEILKLIKDKRLLALGYAEKKVKKAILKYIESRTDNVNTSYTKAFSITHEAMRGITICKQISNNEKIGSLSFMLDEANILGVETVGNDIHVALDIDETIILVGAKILEKEGSPVNAYIRTYELHKTENGYELHLLLMKRDENLVANYYYTTYAFKDMQLKN